MAKKNIVQLTQLWDMPYAMLATVVYSFVICSRYHIRQKTSIGGKMIW